MGKKISVKLLFGVIFFVLFVSRILVLTGNYTLPIDPILLQIIYIVLILVLLLIKSKGKIKLDTFKHKDFFKVALILLLHTIVWGKFLVNPMMIDLTTSQFKSQIMFVVIVILTACATIKFDAVDTFIKSSFYALSFVLVVQLVSNFSDLNLSNIANIMSKSERTRANFGFGHYNTLGGACLCNVILWSMLKKENIEKLITTVFMSISIIMLLCSASRSSLTGLIAFIAIVAFEKFYNNNISNRKKIAITFIEIIIFGVLIIFAFNLDFNEILIQSQRSLLFEKALPEFWSSGRVYEGLGYVSNTAYGTHLTPYTTYWLDNGYIYILISTGIIGFALILYAIYILLKNFYFSGNVFMKTKIFPILVVYMYTALFEANLFNSGSITNYVYLVIFLTYIYNKENIFKEKNISIQ